MLMVGFDCTFHYNAAGKKGIVYLNISLSGPPENTSRKSIEPGRILNDREVKDILESEIVDKYENEGILNMVHTPMTPESVMFSIRNVLDLKFGDHLRKITMEISVNGKDWQIIWDKD